jgi:hypothetical protein
MFGATCPLEDTNCETQGYFDWGTQNHWLEQVWNGDKRCSTVDYSTEFSIYDPNDYRRCVCRNFDDGNDLCMISVDFTDDTTTDTCTHTTQTDGIWTGVEWSDTDNSYQVVNGILEGTSTEAIRRITSARNLDGDGSNYLSLTNV